MTEDIYHARFDEIRECLRELGSEIYGEKWWEESFDVDQIYGQVTSYRGFWFAIDDLIMELALRLRLEK